MYVHVYMCISWCNAFNKTNFHTWTMKHWINKIQLNETCTTVIRTTHFVSLSWSLHTFFHCSSQVLHTWYWAGFCTPSVSPLWAAFWSSCTISRNLRAVSASTAMFSAYTIRTMSMGSWAMLDWKGKWKASELVWHVVHNNAFMLIKHYCYPIKVNLAVKRLIYSWFSTLGIKQKQKDYMWKINLHSIQVLVAEKSPRMG